MENDIPIPGIEKLIRPCRYCGIDIIDHDNAAVHDDCVEPYVDYLENRLEMDPRHTIDGIAARDETIKALECKIVRLEARMIGLPPKRDPDEFVTDVYGYVYYWPTGCNGHFASHHLRRIATELDDRNAEWDAQIKRDIGDV